LKLLSGHMTLWCVFFLQILEEVSVAMDLSEAVSSSALLLRCPAIT